MPIYLPPISRRQFLAGALAAGASRPMGGFAEQGARLSASSPARYLLMSDVHVGAHFHDEKHGVKPDVLYSHAIDQILALAERPRHVIAAGDYAISEGNHGIYKMFHELTARFSAAGMSCRFALGNHDSRGPFLDVFRAASELTDPHARSLHKYVHVYETAAVNWFFLDSLHEKDRNQGQLGAAQLDWLAQALDARRDKPALVVGHHNPSLGSAIRDTAAFYEVIVRRRQVKAYIFGHTHRWNLGQVEGIHLVNVPTISAWKEDDQPRGFLTAELHRDGMRLALHTLGHHGRREHQLTWRKA
jgi:3',5'-cyclic AMP phosphodiesterase CpdA